MLKDSLNNKRKCFPFVFYLKRKKRLGVQKLNPKQQPQVCGKWDVAKDFQVCYLISALQQWAGVGDKRVIHYWLGNGKELHLLLPWA